MNEKEMKEEYEKIFDAIPLDELLKSAFEKLVKNEHYTGFFIPIKDERDDKSE